MRCIATGIQAIGLAMAAALLAGCQVYLHDEALQKQTAAAVAAYKEADVPGAIKATIAAQEKFDEQMLSSIVAEDAAARDLEIAALLDSGQAGALWNKINQRLLAIGGAGARFEIQDWKNGLTAIQSTRTQLDDNTRVVNLMARLYREAGGTAFKECNPGLQLPADVDANLKAASDALMATCAAWTPMKDALDQLIADYDQRVCKSNPDAGSEIEDVCEQLEEADRLIAADLKEADATRANLDKAKKELADAREAAAPEERIAEKLAALKAELDRADKLVAQLGAVDSKPSSALAAIEFRQTNLCDVLFAGAGASCAGGKVDEQAQQTNEALIGLIAGFSKVMGPPPETDALTIALAYQNGLQRAVQARLEGRKAQRVLLAKRQNAIVQEVEYLLQARSELDGNHEAILTKSCSAPGLSAVLRRKDCAGRAALSNALTAYNLSWADGRTAARIANARLTMRMSMTSLHVAQATAASRDEMLTMALAGLDAFGHGGLTTQTIAELLQALGIAAIANGVN